MTLIYGDGRTQTDFARISGSERLGGLIGAEVNG